MKKRFLFTVTIAFLHGVTQSQINVTQSDVISSEIGTFFVDAGKDDDRILVIQANLREDLVLTTLNNETLAIESTNTLMDRKSDGTDGMLNIREWTYHKTIFFGGKSVAFFESYIDATSKHTLVASMINDKGQLENYLTIIDEHEVKNRRQHGSYWITPSVDSTRLLVVFNPRVEDLDDHEAFNFKIFDRNMENTHNFEVELPYKDLNLTVIDYYLYKDNSIFILCRFNKERADREEGKSDYFYTVLIINPETGQLGEFKISLDGKQIMSMQLQVNNRRNMIFAAGLYGNLEDNRRMSNEINGFFFLSIDPKDMTVLNESFKPFESGFAAQVSGVNPRRVSQDENQEEQTISKEFAVVDVIDRSDSSFVVLTEYRNDLIVYSSTGGTKWHYYRKNILAINLDKYGNVVSLIDIPKYQHTINDGGLFNSFITKQSGDRLFVIYNDHPNNLCESVQTIRDVRKVIRPKNTVLVAAEIMPEGYTKQVLWDNRNQDLVARPLAGVRIAYGEYVIPSTRFRRASVLNSIGWVFANIFSREKTKLIRVAQN